MKRRPDRQLFKTLLTAMMIVLIGAILTPLALAQGETEESQIGRSNAQGDAGTIRGIVFQDWDQDGERDAEEPTLAGALLRLYDMRGLEVARYLTAVDGVSFFENVAPGEYILVEEDPLGYSSLQDSKALVIMTPNETVEVSFADVLLLGAPTAEFVPEVDAGGKLLPAPLSTTTF